MTLPTPDALVTLLRMEFRPADVGDTPQEFTDRLAYVAAQAAAREGATTPQVEAGARYALITAQIQQLTRTADEQRGASGSSIRRGLDTRLAALQRAQAQQLALSGLVAATTITRPRSVTYHPEVD
ncbi:hypothetical protein [Deinococcus kurensis]|uniref:hypothetical protein n=1 Tax=Deinococcus kurensis TaxID=2662757 RepID=UPI0012D34C6E|nr:hypothetical protein [Deinococcus kurensis]